MPVTVSYLSEDSYTNPELKNLVRGGGELIPLIDKIKASASTRLRRCRPEVYKDCYLSASDTDTREEHKSRLCTVRINKKSRLFYTVYKNQFIPLDICEDHDLDNFYLAQDQAARDAFAKKIIAQIKDIPGATTVEPIALSSEQKTVATLSQHTNATLCFGPPGVGKTEVAMEIVLDAIAEKKSVRYFTLGSRLCSQVSNELSGSVSATQPSDDEVVSEADSNASETSTEPAENFVCETWDDLHASLIDIFQEVKTILEAKCHDAQAAAKTAAQTSTKKTKAKTVPEKVEKTDDEKLLDLLNEVLNASDKEAVNFAYFNGWFKSNKDAKTTAQKAAEAEQKSKKSTGQKIAKVSLDTRLHHFDPYQLFAEFTRVIIQPTSDISKVYLTEAEYLALSNQQSYVPNDPNKRKFVYDFFQAYLCSFERNEVYYEPHLHMHRIFQCIEIIKKLNISQHDDQDEIIRDFFARIRKYLLILDETQQMPIGLLHVLMALDPRELFLFADPHQVIGAQAPHIVEPIKKMLERLRIQSNTFALNKNFRNAKRIGDVANILLHFERQLFGSSEREAEFLLDCSDTVNPGIIDCKPDDISCARDEKGDHRAVIIVPDAFKVDAEFYARWGNNVLPISAIGGLEWDSVTLVGFSEQYGKQLKELEKQRAEYLLQVPVGNTAFARKKEEELPSLAARDVLHRLYTITTRAKYELHIVDENLFLKALIDTAAPSVAAQTSDVVPTRPRKKSTPLGWIQRVNEYFSENPESEVTEKILWGEEIWGGLLRPKIKDFLLSEPYEIDTLLHVMQSLFEMEEKNRINWLAKIIDYTSESGEKTDIEVAILRKQIVADFDSEQRIIKERQQQIEAENNRAMAASSEASNLSNSKPSKNVKKIDRGKFLADLLSSKNSNIKVISTLLTLPDTDLDATINSVSGTRCLTILHLAALNGHDKVVELLLEKGAQVDRQGGDDVTPLHVAAENGHDTVVKLLLTKKAQVETRTHCYGATPLHAAADSGHHSVVKLLLEAGAQVDAWNSYHKTPLHVAAQNGHDKVVELLLKKKAQIDARTDDDGTPLHAAAQNGHHSIVKRLLAAKAQVDARTNIGATALLIAAQEGHDSVVKLLLEAGAQVDAQGSKGLTPLLLAAENGHDSIVESLLAAKAQVDARTSNGATALFLAAQDGHDSIVKRLLEAGAQVDARTIYDAIPLHTAAQNGHHSVVKRLLAGKTPKAQVDARANNGATPLHLAAQYGHVKVVKLLLEKEAQVDAWANNGATPLHSAAENGHDGVVKLLLEAGANVDVQACGDTALAIARRFGNGKIVELLLAAKEQPTTMAKHHSPALFSSSNQGPAESGSQTIRNLCP